MAWRVIQGARERTLPLRAPDTSLCQLLLQGSAAGPYSPRKEDIHCKPLHDICRQKAEPPAGAGATPACGEFGRGLGATVQPDFFSLACRQHATGDKILELLPHSTAHNSGADKSAVPSWRNSICNCYRSRLCKQQSCSCSHAVPRCSLHATHARLRCGLEDFAEQTAAARPSIPWPGSRGLSAAAFACNGSPEPAGLLPKSEDPKLLTGSTAGREIKRLRMASLCTGVSTASGLCCTLLCGMHRNPVQALARHLPPKGRAGSGSWGHTSVW